MNLEKLQNFIVSEFLDRVQKNIPKSFDSADDRIVFISDNLNIYFNDIVWFDLANKEQLRNEDIFKDIGYHNKIIEYTHKNYFEKYNIKDDYYLYLFYDFYLNEYLWSCFNQSIK